MKKNNLKQLITVILIILSFFILLLVYGFVSTAKDQKKSPSFQKFVIKTNFPINDYFIDDEPKEKVIMNEPSEIKKEKEQKQIDNENKSSWNKKIEDIQSSIKSAQYDKDIFPSNEEVKAKKLENDKKLIINSLANDLPIIKIEKNNLLNIEPKELEFGDSSFSNLKNKNSVTNETKLYRTITRDKKIPVILTSSINSSLSGQVTGIVEDDIYASMGTAKLVPKGSKAIGFYKSNAQLGENRFALRWKSFITPQGIHIILDDAQSADIKGNSGVLGELDDRYWERYGLPLTLSTLSNSILLAVSNAVTKDNNSNANTNTQVILDNSRQDLSYIMKKIIDEQTKVKPIIKVREASRVFIVSKYDIWFPRPKKGEILIKYYNKKEIEQ